MNVELGRRVEASTGAVLYGPAGLPEWTFAPQQVAWCSRYLRQPDGPRAGRSWRFTREQLRFLAWWYAVDGDGRFLFDSGVLRRMKGWGKDPFGAVLCLLEGFGPCRFDGWKSTDHGREPVAVTHPAAWVQTVAVSLDQTRNTMRLFPGLIPRRERDGRPGRFRQAFGDDVGKTIIYGVNGQVLEAVTSSPDSLEGGRTTFTLANETQNWRASNDGHAMAEVIEGNAVKSRDGSSRALRICNAHVPGEDTVAERDWDAFLEQLEGDTRAETMLCDVREASADTDLADEVSLRRGIVAARGDSTWVDPERICRRVWDPRAAPSESRRKYLNQVDAAEDAWVAPAQWDVCADASVVVADREVITLGFDGSETDDHTALVGCVAESGHVFTVGVWRPEQHGGRAPRELIDETVRSVFDRWDVVGFFADLHPWESYVDHWAVDLGAELLVKASGRHRVAFDMRSRTKEFTVGCESTHRAVVDQVLTHDGDSRLAQHVYNARRRPNAWGVSVGKEHRESQRKIDGVPAMVLARLARQAYLALPESRRRKRRSTTVRRLR